VRQRKKSEREAMRKEERNREIERGGWRKKKEKEMGRVRSTRPEPVFK
jgi:hypothetical protein